MKVLELSRSDTDCEFVMNRLAKEKSPYLLQHADNPVDWFPWSEEALEKSRRDNKPIFLSVGYSTCHWCHIMEEESFKRQDIADILNHDFVPVKVDRDERPDLDQSYMKAVIAMTGQGGWPLTVFLTPSRKPFYGGTYFPAENKWGHRGLKETLLSVGKVWREMPREVETTADFITEKLKEGSQSEAQNPDFLDDKILKRIYAALKEKFDSQHGGFGAAPKFPSMYQIFFLNRYWQKMHDPQALVMVGKTLRAMAMGGIFDQLGGGFHRYATDRKWQVPHFEKMLYDQALMVRGYLEAYQVTHNQDYAWVANEILEYVLRDLASSDGGFYSGQDADSPEHHDSPQKKEGSYYLWTAEEIRGILGQESGEIVSYYFGIKEHGNVQGDVFEEFKEKNILSIAHSPSETARHFHKSLDEVLEILSDVKEQLSLIRQKRPRPFLDDKILTDWNGLMISALACGGRILLEKRFIQASMKAADFILSHLRDEKGGLMHRYRDGESAIPGMLEDYAFFIQGLIDLYEVSFSIGYLKEARDLSKKMIDLFWDKVNGGFFMTTEEQHGYTGRPKDASDQAIPSGNAVAAMDILRLGRILQDRVVMDYGEKAVYAFSTEMKRYPGNFMSLACVLDFLLAPPKEFIFVAGADIHATERMLEQFYSNFVPNSVVVLKPFAEDEAKAAQDILPYLRNQKSYEGKTTVFVCEKEVCLPPMTSEEQFRKYLQKGGNGKLPASRTPPH